MRLVLGLLMGLLLTACAHVPQPTRTYPHAWTQALPPRPVPPVKLAAVDGDFYLDQLKGRWVWLFFGYGSCPDVCPTTLSYLAQAYGKLPEPGRVQVVFVSVDPARDTPAKLATMAAYFNHDFKAVTGAPTALETLAGAVGAAYRREPSTRADGNYTISHSNAVFVLDPEGRQVASYLPDADPMTLASDFGTP
jgi:protein SCO1/2